MSGLDAASSNRPYALRRRTCALVESKERLVRLDARAMSPIRFTPGALRGGTHRPEWSADGKWIGFTYDDALLADIEERTGEKVNLRTVGVATFQDGPVLVDKAPENNDGLMFSAVVVRVTPNPRPGSDEIKKTFEDSWIGRDGYRRPDGFWQRRARAFLGTVVDENRREFTEVFVVDIPDRLDEPEHGERLEGFAESMPSLPRGTRQRRLTFTAHRKHPGVSLQPRHWFRSAPDGSEIAYLAKDDNSVVQIFLVSPETGKTRQITEHDSSIQSSVRWSPDGRSVLYVCDNSVMTCDVTDGISWNKRTRMLTAASEHPPEPPVWSNDGRIIAFNRRVIAPKEAWKQIFIIDFTP
jgi:dipeptidyl aminopeptidase/acylaminoacyl peptidase